MPEDLDSAVNHQAAARLHLDVPTYASYLAPEAIDSLRPIFVGPDRLSAYEILEHQQRGRDRVVTVRFSSRAASFEVCSRWALRNGCWAVTRAERAPPRRHDPGLLSRIASFVLGRRPRA